VFALRSGEYSRYILQDEPDMISALMDQKYRDGRPLRDHEIAHIMIALLMAGQHTSSASGSWTLLHLAHNVEVQLVQFVVGS
jgi:sterol 14-demethylase